MHDTESESCIVLIKGFYRMKVGNEASSENKLNGLALPDPVRHLNKFSTARFMTFDHVPYRYLTDVIL